MIIIMLFTKNMIMKIIQFQFHLMPQTGHHTVALLHTELATTGSYRLKITILINDINHIG